ncbi:hypothetical protein FRC12_022659, partial [Ceratobasidium sp. 428]
QILRELRASTLYALGRLESGAVVDFHIPLPSPHHFPTQSSSEYSYLLSNPRYGARRSRIPYGDMSMLIFEISTDTC